jgi:sortase A
MKKYNVNHSRAKTVISWVLSLIMIVAGAALIASFFLAGRLDSTATNSDNPGGFNVPKLETTTDENTSNTGPRDKTLELTVPAMARIENDDIPYTTGTDEEALKENAAVHLQGTGFPWEKTANVYIAGHRLGYPNTESWLTFWDLSNVGVDIYFTDATAPGLSLAQAIGRWGNYFESDKRPSRAPPARVGRRGPPSARGSRTTAGNGLSKGGP